jgi:competence protein ComEA
MVVTEVRQPAADPAQAPADSTAPPVSYAPVPDLDPASIALIPRSGPQGPAAPAMLAPPAPTQPPPPTPSSRTTLKPAVSPASKPASDAKAKPPTPGLIQLDINSATQSQLEQLPGIGPALAQRIVEYRTQKGRFTRVEDLDAVKGIGPKLLEKIRPHVTVK